MNNTGGNRIAYRPREAAEALGISPPTMYRWMALEGFPVVKVGGCTLIPASELERWLLQQNDAPGGGN